MVHKPNRIGVAIESAPFSSGDSNRKPSAPWQIVTFVNACNGGSWYDSLMKKILASLLLLVVCASPVFAAKHHHHKKHHHPHQPA